MCNMMTLLLSLLQLMWTGPQSDPWTAPLAPAEDPAFTAELQETPGFWAGKADEVWLRQLQRNEIVSISFNRGGSSVSLRFTFKDGSMAAFKPDQHHEQTVPRFEIAAYRMNRLLGMSRVPPATWRRISKAELFEHLDEKSRIARNRILEEVQWDKDGTVAGEVSVWIPVIRAMPLETFEFRRKWVRWLAPYDYLWQEEYSLAGQISNMILFDFLVNNPDRFTGNNTLSDERMKRLYYMDNTYAFYPSGDGSSSGRQYLRIARRYSEKMIRSLQRLDIRTIRSEVVEAAGAPWPILGDEEIEALLQRKEYLIREITRNIAHFGWEKTVVFP
ncbi:hypothetical protein KJ612_06675 [Myxococcota bacterium]|nr:hypothetical protein [Myxococcota bacterium]